MKTDWNQKVYLCTTISLKGVINLTSRENQLYIYGNIPVTMEFVR